MSTTVGFCTIIAKNYVAAARTLCRSWQEYHPGSDCYVLVVDETEGYLRSGEEPYTLVCLSELSLPTVEQFTFKYSVVELCTAVKPFLMEFLLRNHPLDRLVYLDPDILVTGSLQPVLDMLDDEATNMLITPHLDPAAAENEPAGMDTHLMRHGIFNLGFLAVSNRRPARRFLSWFQSKLLDKCVQDYDRGFFVDQKFIDYALGLFPGFRIVWDPGCNVATWNALNRRVSREAGAWHCNGVPLRFFHFSTFKPLGKSPAHNRTFIARADLRPLFEEYEQALLANGYRETSAWPYTFGRFSDGTRIPTRLRRHYRDALADGTLPSPDPARSGSLNALASLCQAEDWWRGKLGLAGFHWDRFCAWFIRRLAGHGNPRA